MYCRTEPKHPKQNSNGLYPLHRVLMEIKLGRSLVKGEDVHHKDENKDNNHPDNLEVLTKSEHARLHRPNLDKVKIKCEGCSNIFKVKPLVYRQRTNRNKSKKIYCSLSCGSKMTKNL